MSTCAPAFSRITALVGGHGVDGGIIAGINGGRTEQGGIVGWGTIIAKRAVAGRRW